MAKKIVQLVLKAYCKRKISIFKIMIYLIIKKICSVIEKLLFGETFEFLQYSRKKVFTFIFNVKINIFEKNALSIIEVEILRFKIKSS